MTKIDACLEANRGVVDIKLQTASLMMLKNTSHVFQCIVSTSEMTAYLDAMDKQKSSGISTVLTEQEKKDLAVTRQLSDDALKLWYEHSKKLKDGF